MLKVKELVTNIKCLGFQIDTLDTKINNLQVDDTHGHEIISKQFEDLKGMTRKILKQ